MVEKPEVRLGMMADGASYRIFIIDSTRMLFDRAVYAPAHLQAAITAVQAEDSSSAFAD